METIEVERLEFGAPGSVQMKVFSDSGVVLASGMYTDVQWYLGRNALIDDVSERHRLNVAKIVVAQYGADGQVGVCWSLHYDENGRLVEAYERGDVGAASRRSINEVMAQRLRLVASA